MIYLRKSLERGQVNVGWLQSSHTFSFGEYHDPKHMGFRCLRVINEDFIDADTGFDTHGHRDMEIISYVVSGELSHKDSMGNATRILPGEVQRMTAGTGIRHSEFNHSKTETCHLLQIWLLPRTKGETPSYDQKSVKDILNSGHLSLVASADGRNNSVLIHQDVDLYALKSDKPGAAKLALKPGRFGWIQIISGQIKANGQTLTNGDALGISEVDQLTLEWGSGAHFLIFDLP